MSTAETLTSPEDSLLWTLEEISRLISQSGNPTETLTNIVHLIQRRFETDVLLGVPARARSRQPGARGDDRLAA